MHLIKIMLFFFPHRLETLPLKSPQFTYFLISLNTLITAELQNAAEYWVVSDSGNILLHTKNQKPVVLWSTGM